jgi:hypothetical protein
MSQQLPLVPVTPTPLIEEIADGESAWAGVRNVRWQAQQDRMGAPSRDL